MSKLKQLWTQWRGTIGFVGGALVVSTTYFTCSVQPNTEAIQQAVLEEATEAPSVEEEPKPTETE